MVLSTSSIRKHTLAHALKAKMDARNIVAVLLVLLVAVSGGGHKKKGGTKKRLAILEQEFAAEKQTNQQRSDEQQATIDSLNATLARLQQEDTSDNSQITFSVSDSDKTSYSAGDVLKFDRIVSNPNNAYNESTGEFTAPVSGTYVFSVSVVCWYHPYGQAYFQLKCGGTVVTTVVTYCKSSSVNVQSASGAAIAHVTQGGVCRVEAKENSGVASWGDHPGLTNSFTGFLLFEN